MIPTQNRFTYNEEASPEHELYVNEEYRDFSNYKRKRKGKAKIQKIPYSRSSGKLSFVMKSLIDFKTDNAFEVFNKYTEEEANRIVCGEVIGKLATTIRTKCKFCGYKRKCHLQGKCKSYEKNCFACSKPNHFPKSLNCKVQRKKKAKDSNFVYSCETLRQFLKISGYRLSSRIIPFKELSKKMKARNESEKCYVNEHDNLSEHVLKQIQNKISSLESFINCYKRLEKCSFSTKISFVTYLLLNLEHICVINPIIKDCLNETQSETNENIYTESCYTSEHLGVPEFVANFFEISKDSTHYLKNYAEPNVNNVFENLERLDKARLKCKANVKKYSEK